MKNSQQTHQKNQVKDTIEVDEPEGTYCFPYELAPCADLLSAIPFANWVLNV